MRRTFQKERENHKYEGCGQRVYLGEESRRDIREAWVRGAAAEGNKAVGF